MMQIKINCAKGKRRRIESRGGPSTVSWGREGPCGVGLPSGHDGRSSRRHQGKAVLHDTARVESVLARALAATDAGPRESDGQEGGGRGPGRSCFVGERGR